MEIYIIDTDKKMLKWYLTTLAIDLFIKFLMGANVTWWTVFTSFLIIVSIMTYLRAKRGWVKYKFVYGGDKVKTNDEDFDFENA